MFASRLVGNMALLAIGLIVASVLGATHGVFWGWFVGCAIGFGAAECIIRTGRCCGDAHPSHPSHRPMVCVRPDASIEIDLSTTPPTIRAIAPSAPVERRDVFIAGSGTQGFSLTATPTAGQIERVYRNGLLMAPGPDYALTGAAVAFTAGQSIQGGDIIQVIYR